MGRNQGLLLLQHTTQPFMTPAFPSSFLRLLHRLHTRGPSIHAFAEPYTHPRNLPQPQLIPLSPLAGFLPPRSAGHSTTVCTAYPLFSPALLACSRFKRALQSEQDSASRDEEDAPYCLQPCVALDRTPILSMTVARFLLSAVHEVNRVPVGRCFRDQTSMMR
eukprot:33657-Rhodomonas_salina.2